jgi:ABC-type polysaccharide/polyol phosphate export permease
MHSLKTLWQFVHLDLRQSYFKRFFIVVELISLFLTILIYHFTAKAFVPKEGTGLNFFGEDFFSFLFWGDLVLRIPQNFFFSPVNNLKQSIAENTFEPLILHAGSEQLIFLGLAVMQIFRELITVVVMIVIAVVFFDLHLPSASLLKVVLLTLAFTPVYVSIGIVMAALIFRAEKGEGILYLFSNGLAILAGMYFPVEVFPEFLQKIGLYLSPYSFFLRTAREYLNGKAPDASLLLIFLLGILAYFFAMMVMKKVYLGKRIRGDSLLMS